MEISWGRDECDERRETAKERRLRELKEHVLKERRKWRESKKLEEKRKQEELEQQKQNFKDGKREFKEEDTESIVKEGNLDFNKLSEKFRSKEVSLNDLERIHEFTKETILKNFETELKEQVENQIDSQFRKLMKEYFEATNKKADYGLKITKKFKKWIKHNPSIDEFEKQKFIEYCNDYEKQLPKLKLEELRDYVRQHHPGGEILATEYVNSNAKIPVRCAEGHVWEIRTNTIKQGNWCRKCADKEAGLKRRGVPLLTLEKRENMLEELREYVRQHRPGGEILALEYTNDRTKIPVRCAEGHVWEITPNHLKKGRWCPDCSEGVNERISRKLFEAIFKKEFPKSRPEWLVNDQGNQMELDGYNEELALAFEYQGRQHYEYNEYFHKSMKDFEQRKADDKLKRELCKRNDITLIEIPYTIEPDKMQDYIINKCNKNKITTPKIKEKINYSELDIYSSTRSRKLKELKNYVRAQHPGGEVLTTEYINSRTKVPVRCAEGHLWEITPNHIKSGHWCPTCAGNERLTLEELKEYVRQQHPGGECMATEYINNRTKVPCRCEEGHVWEITPSNIRSGKWCPKCKNKYRKNKKKKTNS
ncbi:MAG: hypothetical protein HWN65_12110 [Candidatus Helarchaeota archaeon]|nr:hypothetical protein [Candidatus Helarchaeota archaeon]